MYDTGKVLNILLQGDGYTLEHLDSTEIVHIGGVSHFLAPPSSAPAARDEPPRWGEGPDWGEAPDMRDRYAVARYTAELMLSFRGEGAAPAIPDIAPELRDRLESVRVELSEVFARHLPEVLPGNGVHR